MGAVQQRPSPNCGPRKGGISKPDMVVLHYTAMQSAEDAICTLCDPEKEVSAHSDLAPLRKFDPGGRFDWRRLAVQDLSVWPTWGEDLPLAESLTALGYGVAEFGVEPCLNAFRQRFAPWRDGAECLADRRGAASLAAQFAVDPLGGAS